MSFKHPLHFWVTSTLYSLCVTMCKYFNAGTGVLRTLGQPHSGTANTHPFQVQRSTIRNPLSS